MEGHTFFHVTDTTNSLFDAVGEDLWDYFDWDKREDGKTGHFDVPWSDWFFQIELVMRISEGEQVAGYMKKDKEKYLADGHSEDEWDVRPKFNYKRRGDETHSEYWTIECKTSARPYYDVGRRDLKNVILKRHRWRRHYRHSDKADRKDIIREITNQVENEAKNSLDGFNPYTGSHRYDYETGSSVHEAKSVLKF